MSKPIEQYIRDAIGTPSEQAISDSRHRVKAWFERSAPLIVWDEFRSPLGRLYVAASERGVCNVAFGIKREDFLAKLDPLAHVRHDPQALVEVVSQLRAYFQQPALRFELPLDLSRTTPFQRAALQLIRQIPAGQVWTYKQVAEALNKPAASRAVGQAMAHNPVPIIVPCHRVVGSNGTLTGYGGGGGIATKRRLLQMEGAL